MRVLGFLSSFRISSNSSSLYSFTITTESVPFCRGSTYYAFRKTFRWQIWILSTFATFGCYVPLAQYSHLTTSLSSLSLKLYVHKGYIPLVFSHFANVIFTLFPSLYSFVIITCFLLKVDSIIKNMTNFNVKSFN